MMTRACMIPMSRRIRLFQKTACALSLLVAAASGCSSPENQYTVGGMTLTVVGHAVLLARHRQRVGQLHGRQGDQRDLR